MPRSLIILAALLSGIAVVPAGAAQQRDQDVAFLDAQRGKILPLPRIERAARDHPAVRGAKYLGPELDRAVGVYRLKFMRGGRVIWIDVDGRTGRVLQTSGD